VDGGEGLERACTHRARQAFVNPFVIGDQAFTQVNAGSDRDGGYSR
jgi:hypothetical protein